MVVWGTGVVGVNFSYRLRDFPGGTSRIVAIDEIRAGIDPLDPRGVWASGLAGLERHSRGRHLQFSHDEPGGQFAAHGLAPVLRVQGVDFQIRSHTTDEDGHAVHFPMLSMD